MKNSQKGFVLPLLIIIVVVLVIGTGTYFYQKNVRPTNSIKTTDSVAHNDPVIRSNINLEGNYSFSEFSPPDENWKYSLIISSSTNGFRAEINIDGFQTLCRINAILNLDSNNSLNAIFDSYNSGNGCSGSKKGDVLFSLVLNADNSLNVEWKTLQPLLSKDMNESLFTKETQTTDSFVNKSVIVVAPEKRQITSSQELVLREGPGNLSVKVPKDVNEYLDKTTHTDQNPNKTELIASIESYYTGEYFKSKGFYPSYVEFFVSIGEAKYDKNVYCGFPADYLNITSNKNYLINGLNFTEIRDKSDSGNSITLSNITGSNMCRYVRLTLEYPTEEYLRSLLSQDPNKSQKEINTTIDNTKLGQEHFSNLSEQILKTVSVK
ncbi:MAG: DUF5991 domain-containing protein [bacterium]